MTHLVMHGVTKVMCNTQFVALICRDYLISYDRQIEREI